MTARGEYVPFSLFPRLVEHPPFFKATLAVESGEEYPYPKLDRALNNVVTALNGGASPEQAASHALYRHEGKVFLGVGTDYSDASEDAIRRFLAESDVYVPGKDAGPFGAHWYRRRSSSRSRSTRR